MARLSVAVAQYTVPASSDREIVIKLPTLPLKVHSILVATDQDVSFNSDFYSPMEIREISAGADTDSIKTARIEGSFSLSFNDPDYILIRTHLNFKITNNATADARFIVIVTYVQE